MSELDTIEKIFSDSIETKQRAMSVMAAPIAKAVDVMIESLTRGNKVLSCGNGGSAADAQHI